MYSAAQVLVTTVRIFREVHVMVQLPKYTMRPSFDCRVVRQPAKSESLSARKVGELSVYSRPMCNVARK